MGVSWYLMLLGLVFSGGAAAEERKSLKCKNPSGKLWSSIFNANCGQSVCKKSGKKANWQSCPKAATEENIEELKDFLLEMKKELEVKIEQTCGMSVPVPTEVTTTTLQSPTTSIEGFFSARSSSQYGIGDGLWSADYAIDGKISEENHNFFSSLSESNPWLELSMPEGYISGVEIVTRYGCCADRVRDIEVRAGMDPVPNGFKGRLTINTKVATFVGPADANLKTYRINFDRSILAKYVTLQRIGEGVNLEINEVTMIR